MEHELVFKHIEYEDLPFIQSVVNKQTYRSCDYTVYNLYTLRDYYQYTYAKVGDGLMLRYIEDNEIVYSFPLVFKDSPYEFIESIKEKINFSMLSQEEVLKLEEKYQVEAKPERDYFDYLYEIDELSLLPGKRNNKLRNHVNKFNSMYEGKYTLSEITNEDGPRIAKFIEEYRDHENEDESYNHDLESCKDIFLNYDKFKDYFISYKLEIDGRIVAIASGEVIQDTVYLHVLKAFREYQGIYHFMNKSFCSKIKENYPHVIYVNREDDLGDLGLRKSKLQYHPLRFVEKSNVKML